MHFPFLVKIHDGAAEEPRMFMRKHAAILLGTSLLFLLLAAAPFLASFMLPEAVASWLGHPRLGPAVVLLVGVFELFVVLLWYGAFMDWYLDIWVVTNERIVDVDQNGVFGRSVSELQLSKVQDVKTEQKGVFATVFGYGTIRVQSAGEKENFVFDGLPRPNEVARQIVELVQADQRWHREALAEQIKGVK